MDDFLQGVFANRLTIFGSIEWWNFVAAIAGTVVGVISWIEAHYSVHARDREQSGKEVMLLAVKNRRVAWGFTVILALFALQFGFSTSQQPTPSQLMPGTQVYVSYLSLIIIIMVAVYVTVRNYVDYRTSYRFYEEGVARQRDIDRAAEERAVAEALAAALTAAQPIDVKIVDAKGETP